MQPRARQLLDALRALQLGRLELQRLVLAGQVPILVGETGELVAALGGALVRGEGFQHLKALSGLAELDLTGAPVSNEGLDRIAELPGLERLLVSYSDIDDGA